MSDIIRVFPRRTKWTPDDDLAFVGEPPLFDIPKGPICISVTFSWDSNEAVRLLKVWRKRYPGRVDIGGPLYPWIKSRWKRFYPGRFVKNGIVFTSRGCNKRCPWCRVWHYEGPIMEINIADGYIVQDNNLLACSRGHIEKVFEMLSRQKKAIEFKGGLDIDYLDAWHVDLLKKIRVGEIWVACDSQKDLFRLDKAADLLSDFSIEKKRCYCLIGFNGETLVDAERRLETVYEKGFLPFAQRYKSPHAEFGWLAGEDCRQWAELGRKWSRPAAYRSRQK